MSETTKAGIHLPDNYEKKQAQVPGELDFWKHSFIAAMHHYGLPAMAANMANGAVEELRKKIAEMS